MTIRTTVDIPEPLHTLLRHRAENSGTSIRALIIRALEQAYRDKEDGQPVTGPLVRLSGRKGPRFPVDENPHDLLLP